MKSRSGEKIKLASIDELLGVVNEESAMEIEINRIHAFKDYPFKVLDDEKMADLVESVKTYGVLTPVLLRSDGENGYEMISGHRRMHAAVIAGLKTIPAIVRELSDDDAVQGDSGHSQVDMVTDVYSHIIDEDRRRNAELFEEAFYEKKNLDPKMHDETATQTVDVPDDVDAELLAKVLANPEMKALLASLAKAMK